jgi:hypothetical protein
MRTILLLLLAVTSACFSQTQKARIPDSLIKNDNSVISQITLFARTGIRTPEPTPQYLTELASMLKTEAPNLSPAVINKVLTTLKCTTKYNVMHDNILTVIDYSLPSNEKRLWVFDLDNKLLLFNTYVSHGIKSGALLSTYFSNKYNSKASSIGVYRTDSSYYGREGLSLKLQGLDRNFNDNASNRSVVMHGGWYVEEPFIKKYGRAGRSWGCPALPLALYQPIINTIKDNSLMVIYYPDDAWFDKSKFLTCEKMPPLSYVAREEASKPTTVEEKREDILLARKSKNSKGEVTEPIVATSADSYERLFHHKPPLERMLRRQIDHQEYIALSNAEFNSLVTAHNQDKSRLDDVHFVVAVVVMHRGYYETEMHIVPTGKIKEVKINTNSSDKNKPASGYTVYFESKGPYTLTATNQFIRWLGL